MTPDDGGERAGCISEEPWEMSNQQFAITRRVNARKSRGE